MPLMILSYTPIPRHSMRQYFKKDLGEIFDVRKINPSTFESIQDPAKYNTGGFKNVWRQNWIPGYLEHIEKKILAHPECVFQAHLSHLADSEEAVNLIKKLSPVFINVVPRSEFWAIKQHLVRMEKYRCQLAKKDFLPFTATFNDFTYAYQHCVAMPKLAGNIFSIESSFQYDEVLENSEFPELLKPFLNKFSEIENESEIAEWYFTVSDSK